MKLINRVTLVVGVLVIISLVWFGVRYFQPKVQIQKYTGPVNTIRVGMIGNYSALDLIAKEKGFFAENGLNAIFHEYSSGPSAMNSLLSGDEDFVIAADFAAVDYIFTNPNLRIIAETGNRNGYKIIVRNDSGIKSPTDLRGKKIGFTSRGAGEYILGRLMELNKLSEKDIERVDMQPPEIATAIESGQIDAALTFEPNVHNIQKSLGDNGSIIYTQKDMPTSLLKISTEGFINKNPDLVRRYLGSLVEAEGYTKNNSVEVRNILVKMLPSESDYIATGWPEFKFDIVLNQALLQKMEDQAVFHKKNISKASTTIPNFIDYIYFDALNSTKPEAITIFH